MASLDSLTDGEIRARLSELGCPVGPVTPTTRKVLLKKLKLLQDQNNSSRKNDIVYDPHCASTQFSSGEESDDVSVKSRRKSMPPPRTTKSPKKKSPSRATPSANSTFLNHTVSTTTFDDGGRSSRTTFKGIEGRRSTRQSLGLPDVSSYTSHLRSTNYSSFDDDGNDTFLSRTTPGLGEINTPYSASSRFLNSGAARVDLSDGLRPRTKLSGSTPDTTSGTPSYQPYSSEFAKRLTSLSSNRTPVSTPSSSASIQPLKLLDVKESDDEDNGSVHVYAKFSHGGAKGVQNVQSRIGRGVFSQDSWFSYDSPVSSFLVVILLLFFILIGVVYINMHSIDTNLATTDLEYPRCSASLSPEDCIKDDDVETVKKIFKIVQQELFDRASNKGCTDELKPLSDREIVNLVNDRDKSIGIFIVEANLGNLKLLLDSNPDWKIRVDEKGYYLFEPPTNILCSLYKKFMVVAVWLLKIILFVGGIYACYRGCKLWMWHNARYNDEVYRLVSNILEIVSSKAQDPDSFIPISHVRDQLIPPMERKKMKKLWNDAMAILESDSRLRCEVQQVEGEEFAVWRWLASPLNSKRKVWQGQAFEMNVEGSVNSLPDSPTSCLKIRHMFDPTLEEGEDWVLTVADALLEKCGEAKILHIGVDKQSKEGCVYMKCASQRDAGIAYRALHGSWFDSKLVTVKYIREKRYLERFPDSSRCSTPLRPSNDMKTSLQN